MKELANPNREESEAERTTRNWAEILQELRVAQTGGQIFLAFLLTIAFQPAFADLDDFGRTVYLVLIVAAIASLVAALAPVSAHRALFRQQAKLELVRFGNRMIKLTIALLAVALIGTVLLVFDLVAGRTVAFVAGGTTVLLVVAAWVVWPLVKRSMLPRDDRDETAAEPAER